MKQVPAGLVGLPARAVLGVFAEAADKHGRASYPSLSTVAWHLDCTERNVATHVKALVAAGLLVVSPDQSPADECDPDRRPVVYDLPIHWVRVDRKPDSKKRGRKPRQAGNGVKDSASITEIGVKDSVKRGEESFLNGVKNSSKRGEENFIQTTQEPPKGTVQEPPTAHASSNRRRTPAATGSQREYSKPVDPQGWRLVRDEIPTDHLVDETRAALTKAAGALLRQDKPEHLVREALRIWDRDPNAGVGLLPHCYTKAAKAAQANTTRAQPDNARVRSLTRLYEMAAGEPGNPALSAAVTAVDAAFTSELGIVAPVETDPAAWLLDDTINHQRDAA